MMQMFDMASFYPVKGVCQIGKRLATSSFGTKLTTMTDHTKNRLLNGLVVLQAATFTLLLVPGISPMWLALLSVAGFVALLIPRLTKPHSSAGVPMAASLTTAATRLSKTPLKVITMNSLTGGEAGLGVMVELF
jgi:hypothetical protein